MIRRFSAIASFLAIGLFLASCQPPPRPAPPPLLSMTAPMAPMMAPTPPSPPRPVVMDQPNFYRLRNTPSGEIPARVALLLPLSSPSAENRAVAQALERAAELAIFDAKGSAILLMPRDDGGTPEKAIAAATKAINDGAEIIIGPLFASSVTAIGPVARASHVPVIAFSSDRSVGGSGVYLLSFQPETEVNRIIGYAVQSGHNNFAALIPNSPYGDKVTGAFTNSVLRAGGRVAALERFNERAELVGPAAQAAMKSGADAILIAEGGAMLQAAAPAIAIAGGKDRKVQLLGTGLWDDPALTHEPMLLNGWFAAPPPEAFAAFSMHYRTVFKANPPRIATLAYDALALVSLLANGRPHERFTDVALTDPNGFSGIDGIFRFHPDGSAERGLAVLQVSTNGFSVLDPAPKVFPRTGF
jgi:branched-chain amino acid transport system substrate-binding protein